MLLVLGPLLLALAPQRSRRRRSAYALVLLAGAGALYALLPFAITGIHWYTYPRYATVILLFLLFLPAPRLDGWWVLALVPGVLAVIALDGAVASQFRVFDQKTRPFLQIIQHVQPGGSLLPLVFDDDVVDPNFKLSPYHQMYAYVPAFRKGYQGNLWNHNAVPLLYQQENMKPNHEWNPNLQRGFTVDGWGKHFDYVLVQGFPLADPVAPLAAGPPPRPTLLVEAGRWRLYQMPH